MSEDVPVGEMRWPDDIPPPWARLYKLGTHCLDEVNSLARSHSASRSLEHDLFEILRSQALAITTLSEEIMRLRSELASYLIIGDGVPSSNRSA